MIWQSVVARSALLSIAVLGTNGGCQTREEDGTVGCATSMQALPDPGYYMIPVLPNQGRAIVYCRLRWLHFDYDDIVTHKADTGQPVHGSFGLYFAIWADGTAIWLDGVESGPGKKPWLDLLKENPKYCRARLAKSSLAQLLASIDVDTYLTPSNCRYTEAALRHATTAIAVVKDKQPLYLCSELETMEGGGEYYFWKNHERTAFPVAQYSFEAFCREVPAAYCKFLKDCRELRARLTAALPEKGEQIDLNETIQWVKTTQLSRSAVP